MEARLPVVVAATKDRCGNNSGPGTLSLTCFLSFEGGGLGVEGGGAGDVV